MPYEILNEDYKSKRSKTTNIDQLKQEGNVINNKKAISDTMNQYFCSVGITLAEEIEDSPNPLLSGEYHLKPKFHEQFSMTGFSMAIFICSCRWSHMTIFHMTSVLVQKLACQLFDKCTCHMKNCHM